MVSHPQKRSLLSGTLEQPAKDTVKALSGLQLLDGVEHDPVFWDLLSHLFVRKLAPCLMHHDAGFCGGVYNIW